MGSIAIKAQQFDATIKTVDVSKAAENLTSVLSYGDIGLNYIDPQTKMRSDWNLPVSQYAAWLEVQPDENNQLIFVLKCLYDQWSDSCVCFDEPDQVRCRGGRHAWLGGL